jgi:hypothetical protein
MDSSKNATLFTTEVDMMSALQEEKGSSLVLLSDGRLQERLLGQRPLGFEPLQIPAAGNSNLHSSHDHHSKYERHAGENL